jgi:cysteinyl-tRNA synthetase
LFDGVRIINSVKAGIEKISALDLAEFKSFYHSMVFDILGLKSEETGGSNQNELLNDVMELLINLRKEAKSKQRLGNF